MIVVSPVGTPAENGTALLDALDGIVDASADNPYLLKIEQGTYDLGTMSLVMKEYVDIEGVGEGITTVTASGSPAPDRGTVIGADNAELRWLTVENTGRTADNLDGLHAIAIYNAGTAPRLTHLTVRAVQTSETEVSSYGIYNAQVALPRIAHVTLTARGRAATKIYGIYNRNSFAQVRDALISALGAPAGLESYGVYNHNSSPRLANLVITADAAQKAYGVFNFAQTGARQVTIEASRIFGATNAIFNSGRTIVALSHLSAGGAMIAGGGSVTLNGAYDDDSLSRLRVENDGGPSAGAFLLNSTPPRPGFFGLPPAALVATHEHSSGGFAARFHGLSKNSSGVMISTLPGRPALVVAGGSKNAIVPTSQGARMLYSEESTGVWFSDYGFGRLKDGRASVRIDPMFAEVVDLVEPYHVFLQAYGDADVYVARRSPDGFEVRLGRGDPEVQFSYRLVAKRRGFEEARLERALWAEGDPNLFPNRVRRGAPHEPVVPAE